jgi:hypothetical protein
MKVGNGPKWISEHVTEWNAFLTRIRIRGIAGPHKSRGLVLQWWPEIWTREGKAGGGREREIYRSYPKWRWTGYHPSNPRTSPSQPLDGVEREDPPDPRP